MTAHDIHVTADPHVPHHGTLRCGDLEFPCIIGKAGVTADKREGDHRTPLGTYPLRRLHYRPDVYGAPPETGLPARAIAPQDGWCDDPAHPDYNRPVTLPFAASHERLWRDDRVYDLVVEIGYNDAPPAPGRGSAIFLHLARPDGTGTEGCVALAEPHLRKVLAKLGPGSRITIAG
ncbi:MAG TPA: L,D-transpeptidase family protein [Sphingomonadales bacterium]